MTVIGGVVCGTGRLLAGVYLLRLGAGVTLDEAAPVEAAVASLFHYLLLHRVSPATAHDATSVRTFGGSVARSSMCAKRSHVTVVGTVVGRGVEVHQVFGCRDDRLSIPNLQLAPLVQPDFGRRVVLCLQEVSDLRSA